MRVLVIGLDGLEPSFVNSEELLQNYHGVVDNSGILLQTPVLWASFLTGSTEHDIRGMKSSNRFTNMISRIIGIGWSSRILKHLGLYNPRLYTREDIGRSTIFDLVDRHIVVSVPAYNEPEVYLDIRRNTVKYFDGQYDGRMLIRECMDLFYEERKEFEDLLNSRDWDIAMIHVFVTDTIGHLGIDIRGTYEIMGRWMSTLNFSDVMKLIVSDHGMKRGLHTREGFWSSNIDLGKSKIHITEFYNIIREALYEDKR